MGVRLFRKDLDTMFELVNQTVKISHTLISAVYFYSTKMVVRFLKRQIVSDGDLDVCIASVPIVLV